MVVFDEFVSFFKFLMGGFRPKNASRHASCPLFFMSILKLRRGELR